MMPIAETKCVNAVACQYPELSWIACGMNSGRPIAMKTRTAPSPNDVETILTGG